MGGNGGGSGAGKSDWPDYMKTRHESYLVAIESLITAASNPYTGAVPYDPTTYITNMTTAATNFGNFVDALTLDTQIDASVDAYSNSLINAALVRDVPKFEAGMRDINAVMSSAFVVGKALIMSRIEDQVAVYAADLRSKAFMQAPVWKEASARVFLEAYRMSIIAFKEKQDEQTKLDALEANWPFEIRDHQAKMLGAIGGGAGTIGAGRPPSKEQSALAGAVAGASLGAMVGSAGPQATVGGTLWGAAIGSVIGGVAGYFAG